MYTRFCSIVELQELGANSREATYGSSQPPRDLSSGSVPEAPLIRGGSVYAMDHGGGSISGTPPTAGWFISWKTP